MSNRRPRITLWARVVQMRAERLWRRLRKYWETDIWADTRDVWWVRVAKTIRLSAESFTSGEVQTQAAAMTFRTTLAIVPALALVFAIGRGFGLQRLLQDELYDIFPAQHQAIEASLKFVDSYLNHASEGVFVGIGVVFLLWTLISLVGSVEDAFNRIWGIKHGRTFWRKITDYTAMLLILPILLICASGVTLLVSSTLQQIFGWDNLGVWGELTLDTASWVLTWAFFAAVFMLMPNTRVRPGSALLAGILTGSAFKLLQWLFVSGQLYVTKYNAVYGSFAFLPLMFIWMQLTWMTILTGAVLCYASQNINMQSFGTQIRDMSADYRVKITVVVAAVVAKRYAAHEPVPTIPDIARLTGIPERLVAHVITILTNCDVVMHVVIDPAHPDETGLAPAVPPSQLTLWWLQERLMQTGQTGFIQDFDKRYPQAIAAVDKLLASTRTAGAATPVATLL